MEKSRLGLGKETIAPECLNKAVGKRCGWLPYLANDVRRDPLRSSPEFNRVAARLDLPSQSIAADAV
jgi:hypothetical protein